MSKSMLKWSLVMMFVLVLSLPNVFAQGFTGTPLFYLIANTVVVAVILFIIQAFLVPHKEGKERVSAWFIVIVLSLVVAWNWGRTGMIWDVGFIGRFFATPGWYKVIGNAAILTALGYFILGLIKFKPESPSGNIGAGILLFIVSLVFAVRIGNLWIWEIEALAAFLRYILNILDPRPDEYRLWVFLIAGGLLSYLFKGLLLKDQGFLNYALAFLLAASMAADANENTLGSVIQLGEIIFVIMLAQSLQTNLGADNKIWAWVIAIGLVGWASAAMTVASPEFRGFLGGQFCDFGLLDCEQLSAQAAEKASQGGLAGVVTTFFSKLWDWGWKGALIFLAILIFVIWKLVSKARSGDGKTSTMTWIILGLLVLALIAVFTPFGFGWIFDILILIVVLGIGLGYLVWSTVRNEGRHKITEEGLTRVWSKMLTSLKKTRLGGSILGKYWEQRDKTLDHELPFVFKDLRVELFTLMNWSLRHQIHKSKKKSTSDLLDDIKKREQILAKRIPNKQSINDNMRKYIEGAKIEKVDEAGEWKIAVDPDSTQLAIGFARNYYLILKIMEGIKQRLEQDLTKDVEENELDQDAIKKAFDTWDDTIFESTKKGIEDYYKRYKGTVRRFRVARLVEAEHTHFIDMYNVYGSYKRGVGYAKIHAVPDYYKWDLKEETKDARTWKGVTRKIDWEKVEYEYTDTRDPREIKNLEPGLIGKNFLVEVDIYGYSIRDQNEIEVEGKNLDFIRRYKKEDITYLCLPDHNDCIDPELKASAKLDPPRFNQILDFSTKNWSWFVRDLEKGQFHPYSKNIEDYGYIQDGRLDLDAATFKKLLEQTETAFDREALKMPGEMTYWGKKNYYDEKPDSLNTPPVNPYPAFSVFGLWRFIRSLSDKRIKEAGKADEFLNYWNMDYSDLEKAEGGETSGD